VTTDGEAQEVLVLTDADENVYAIPRRIVERARVPEELKEIFGSPSGRGSGLTPIGAPRWRPDYTRGASGSALPWPVAWFRMPPA